MNHELAGAIAALDGAMAAESALLLSGGGLDALAGAAGAKIAAADRLAMLVGEADPLADESEEGRAIMAASVRALMERAAENGRLLARHIALSKELVAHVAGAMETGAGGRRYDGRGLVAGASAKRPMSVNRSL